MNRWIQKEIRLLLPQLTLGLALIAVAWLIPGASHPGVGRLVAALPILFCPLIMVLLALTSFGREVSTGMFVHLLAQPLDRKQIWWIKNLLLALSLALLWWGWWKATLFHFGGAFELANPALAQGFTVAALAATFSGALLVTLWVREMAAAFWLTVIPPIALALGSFMLLQERLERFTLWWVTIGILGAYSLLAWVLAYRRFMRAEDMVTAGESWHLSSPFGHPPPVVPGKSRGGTPSIWIWVHKELKLHQTVLLLGIPMFMLHLMAISLGNFSSTDGGGVLPTVGFVLKEMAWVLWLGFPLMIGATLIAEERRLGVWERELSLPASFWRILGIKFGLGLAFSVILGGVMPTLLEHNRTLIDLQWDQYTGTIRNAFAGSSMAIHLGEIFRSLPFDPQPVLTMSAVAAGIFLVASFASSLCRSTVQALTLALGTLALGLMFLSWLEPSRTNLTFPPPPFEGPIGWLVIIPLLICILFGLMAINARHMVVTRRICWQNAGLILVVVVGGVTASGGLYHRAWEWVGPLEQVHGPAILKLSDRIQIQRNERLYLFTTLEGRAWEAEILREPAKFWEQADWDYKLSGSIRSLPGTNWASLALCDLETVGIQRDGSLWISEIQSDGLGTPHHRVPASREAVVMTRCGSETSWQQVVPLHRRGALLLKKDGTLWSWAPKRLWRVEDYEGLQAGAPLPISDPSKESWADLRLLPNELQSRSFMLQSRGGEAWMAYPLWITPGTQQTIVLRTSARMDLGLSRAPHLDANTILAQTDFRSALNGNTNGRLRAQIDQKGVLSLVGMFKSHNGQPPEWYDVRLPLAEEKGVSWMGLTSGYGRLVTLRADGTLWTWEFPPITFFKEGTSIQHSVKQLGSNADWVSVSHLHGEVVALAADGGLWMWPTIDAPKTGFDAFLALSSRPKHLGSILP